MPIRYGDEYVYSVADITSGSMPDGSFLLAGYTMIVPTPNGCSPLSDPQAEIRQALRDLTMDGPGCDACGISGTADGSGNTAKVAPKSPVADRLFQFGSTVGPIVVRAHLNDAEAAQCGTYKDACASSLVIEAVVWGELPPAP